MGDGGGGGGGGGYYVFTVDLDSIEIILILL